MTGPISELRVADEGFLVASMIERCPKTMMLRELVQNALEAAAAAPPGRRRVEIGVVLADGVRKLAIWNTGPGLTADELRRMCDIASSIGKPHGLDRNFGMGAKVASLPSNRHGLRYRSCRCGVVHEVMMGKRGGAYGRLRRPAPDAGPHRLADVLVVTAAAQREGRATDSDWTEVVLLGNRPEQDTMEQPYDGDPRVPPRWVADTLADRFFRLAEGTELHLLAGVAGPRPEPFVPLAARLAGLPRHQAVPAGEGVIVHYLHAPGAGAASVVHRNEIYDLRRPPGWVFHAPLFGIPFGARDLAVLVELPDDHKVRPDGYRQFLRWRDAGQAHVEVIQFTRIVARHRPDWLLDLVRSLSPDSGAAESVRGELAELLRSLRVRRSCPAAPAGPPGPPGTPAPPGEPGFDAEPPPALVALRDPADIAERGLTGRAGRWYGETHELFVNLLYPAVDAMREALERDCAHAADQETVRTLATELSEVALLRRLGRAVVFGLVRAGEGWPQWELDQALSPASLSIAADDYAAATADARAVIELRLVGPPRPPRRVRRSLPVPVQAGGPAPPGPPLRGTRALQALLAITAGRKARALPLTP